MTEDKTDDKYRIIETKEAGEDELDQVAEAIATHIVEEKMVFDRLKRHGSFVRRNDVPMTRVFSKAIATKDPLGVKEICILGGLECSDGDCRNCCIPSLMGKHSNQILKSAGKW